MASKTPKKILKDILENLSNEDLNKFRAELLNRGKVKTSQVENKGFLVITDVMVQVYTERNVLQEAEDILRANNCEQAANDLAEEAKKAGTPDCDPAPGPAPRVGVVLPQQVAQDSDASVSDGYGLR